MKTNKTVAELRAELAEAHERLRKLQADEERLDAELKTVRKELLGLRGTDYSHGRIYAVAGQLKMAERREGSLALPRVRLENRSPWDATEWVFVKRTPKRIYLRPLDTLLDECWEINGTSAYRGNIHPEDLAAILEGRIA